VRQYDPDVIICTGDLANSSEFRKVIFKNWNEIENGMTVQDILGRKRYVSLVRRTVLSMDVVLNHLNSLGKPVFLIYGNNDYPQNELNKMRITIAGIEKRVKKYKNLHLMVHSLSYINGYSLVGISGYRGVIAKKAKDTSFLSKFNSLFKKTKGTMTIFLYHDVPFNTQFDKVNNKASPMHGKHVGDPLVNKIIKKYNPVLYLCGHMHETTGSAKSGKTTYVNTGLVSQDDYFIIVLQDKKITVKRL
jgi:hypothetical protein